MTSESKVRSLIARVFALIEDAVYVGLAAVLAVSAVALLVVTAGDFGGKLFSGDLVSQIVPMLDRVLLILLVVELLYTVQVSFRAHEVTPEPFLIVGLIAAIRRVLLLTAEFGQTGQAGSQQIALELAVIAALIVAITLSLYVLRRKDTASRIPKSQGDP